MKDAQSRAACLRIAFDFGKRVQELLIDAKYPKDSSDFEESRSRAMACARLAVHNAKLALYSLV